MMYKKVLLSVCIASLFLTSCSNDDPTPDPNSGKGPFLIQTTVLNTGGMSGSAYLQVISNFSGTVNNSNAYQVAGGSPIAVLGDNVFVFPPYGKDATNKVEKYHYDTDKELKKTEQSLAVPAFSLPYNMVTVSESKAYMPLYTFGQVWVVNPQTMEKTGEINLMPYAHGDNSPDPSYGIIREGLYYLPLDQISSKKWEPYEEYQQADVVVIDVNTDKVVKVISETTSHLSFPTRPFLKNMIFTDEQNNIYMACTGYYGYDANHRKNGFVCIPAGKTEFDPAMSWDISNTEIKGSEYKSSSVLNCVYLGNGKVAAYVGITELFDRNENSKYTTRMAMPVIIDMKTKTIKQIKGIPMSQALCIVVEKYNGKAIFAVSGDDKIGFYTYDPVTDTAEFTLKTQGSPGFFHYFGK